jgi:8-oxo-dGTP diphosphatase
MSIERFNIRVYGLLLRHGQVLVTDETIAGQRITKFPGGGLELGEGPMDCLVRELREELDAEAVGLEHFYTTGFFQPSAYRAGDQIISIYYRFQLADANTLHAGTEAFGTPAEGREWCRWLPVSQAGLAQVTLPIDRLVMELLLKQPG